MSESVVPDEYKEIHREISEIRDKIIAHRDPGPPTKPWGFTNQVWIAISHGQLTVETYTPNIKDELATKLLELLNILIPTMEKNSTRLLKHLPPSLAEGRYLVSLEENPSEWMQSFPRES